MRPELAIVIVNIHLIGGAFTLRPCVLSRRASGRFGLSGNRLRPTSTCASRADALLMVLVSGMESLGSKWTFGDGRGNQVYLFDCYSRTVNASFNSFNCKGVVCEMAGRETHERPSEPDDEGEDIVESDKRKCMCALQLDNELRGKQ